MDHWSQQAYEEWDEAEEDVDIVKPSIFLWFWEGRKVGW